MFVHLLSDEWDLLCSHSGLADTDSCLSNGADVSDRASVFVRHTRTQSSCVQKEKLGSNVEKTALWAAKRRWWRLSMLVDVELQFVWGWKCRAVRLDRGHKIFPINLTNFTVKDQFSSNSIWKQLYICGSALILFNVHLLAVLELWIISPDPPHQMRFALLVIELQIYKFPFLFESLKDISSLFA